MRAIPRLLLGLSGGYVILPVLGEASFRHGRVQARSASPDPSPSAVPDWYGPRPQPNRVVDIEYFEEDGPIEYDSDESGQMAVIWSATGVQSSQTGRPPAPPRPYPQNKQRPTRPRPRPTETLIEINIDEGPELVPLPVPLPVPVYTQQQQQPPRPTYSPRPGPFCAPHDSQCSYGYGGNNGGNTNPYNNTWGNNDQQQPQQQQQQQQRPQQDFGYDNYNNEPQSNDWSLTNRQPTSNYGNNGGQQNPNYGNNGGHPPPNNGNNEFNGNTGNNGFNRNNGGQPSSRYLNNGEQPSSRYLNNGEQPSSRYLNSGKQPFTNYGNNNEGRSNGFNNQFVSLNGDNEGSFGNERAFDNGPSPSRNGNNFPGRPSPLQDQNGYEMGQPSFLNGNPLSSFHPFYDNRVPTFRQKEYFEKPFFWEHKCPRGECAREKFPFLEGARSYCEQNCWNSECLGRNCPGCARECPSIFPGCEAKCFSDECIQTGNSCGRSCWDCGRFMQYRWESNIMRLRERFAVPEVPSVFERGFERCGPICKKPYPGCEVCFDRPQHGCSTCLENPTLECESCVERAVAHERRYQINSGNERLSRPYPPPGGLRGSLGRPPKGQGQWANGDPPKPAEKDCDDSEPEIVVE
jgi:hypothetical protein